MKFLLRKFAVIAFALMSAKGQAASLCRDVFHPSPEMLSASIHELAGLTRDHQAAEASSNSILATALRRSLDDRFANLERFIGRQELKRRLRAEIARLMRKEARLEDHLKNEAKTFIRPSMLEPEVLLDFDMTSIPIDGKARGKRRKTATDHVNASELHVTPDGNWVLAQSVSGAVFASHLPSGKKHFIAIRDGRPRQLHLGSRSDRIVMSEGGAFTAIEMREDGTLKKRRRLNYGAHARPLMFSEDGNQLIFTTGKRLGTIRLDDGKARLFESPSGVDYWHSTSRWAIGRNWKTEHLILLDYSTGTVEEIPAKMGSISPLPARGDRFVILARGDQTVSVYDRLTKKLSDYEGQWSSFDVSPDGKRLLLIGRRNGLSVIEVRELETWDLVSKPIPAVTVKDARFIHGGARVAVLRNYIEDHEHAGDVEVSDVKTGVSSGRIQHRTVMSKLKTSNDPDSFLVSGTASTHSTLLPAATWISLFDSSAVSLNSIVPAAGLHWFDPSGRAAMTRTKDERAYLVSFPDGKAFEQDVGPLLMQTKWDSEGRIAALGTASGKLRVLKLRWTK